MHTNDTPGRTVVAGPQLDIYAAPALLAEIRAALALPGALRIDLQGAERAHAAILQVLVAAAQACTASQRSFGLAGVSPNLAAVLRLAGLEPLLAPAFLAEPE